MKSLITIFFALIGIVTKAQETVDSNNLNPKNIWFFYVVYDYGLAYVGANKGGREIYENALGGRVKYVPRGF